MVTLGLLKPSRFRNELIVLGVSLSVLCALPVAAVFAQTNMKAVATDKSLKIYTGSSSGENKYDYGYCTYWTSKRRADIGAPIPQNWGDAHDWDDNAYFGGYKIDHMPATGAIMQSDSGELGHVAFVEEVFADGRWRISEMNAVGWDVVNDRTFTAKQAVSYGFIH